ncbi:hypothetical protein Tco_0047535 [Tanacetum coccineum]
MGLWYPKDSGFELTAFSDADHAGCLDTRKSSSGGIQFLGDKLVSWMSKKQNCTAMSSAKAEYMAFSASCAQVVRLGINPMIQPEPEDLPKDNPKLEIAVLSMSMLVKDIRSQDGKDDKDNDKGSKSRSQSMKEQAYNEDKDQEHSSLNDKIAKHEGTSLQQRTKRKTKTT